MLQRRGRRPVGDVLPSWSPTARAPIEIVGRFLALLELYRARAVAFDQVRTAWCAASFVDRRPADQTSTWPTAVEEDS